MKTIEEMAWEYALRVEPPPVEELENFARYCFGVAEAMQAEAKKRAYKEPRETHKNLAEFTMYPEYDASINYPPDAWVMYKGEKRLAVSIDIKKEWQPDWSQAPDWANWWAMSEYGRCGWFGEKPKNYLPFSEEINSSIAPDFGYDGDWKDSLRKRPNE